MASIFLNRAVEYRQILKSVFYVVRTKALANALKFSLYSAIRVVMTFFSIYLFYVLAQSITALFSARGASFQTQEAYLLLCGILMALVAVALANYLAIMNAIEVAIKVEQACIARALRLILNLPHHRAVVANNVLATRNSVRKMLGRDARFCGLTARQMMLAVPEGALACGSIAIMLYIYFWLTVVIITISAVALLLQYPINVGASKASRVLEAARPVFARGLVDVTSAIDRVDVDSPRSAEQLGALQANSSFPGDYQHKVYQRLAWVEFNSLVAQTSGAVVLCGSILAVLFMSTTKTPEIAILILYIVSARQAFVHIAKLSRTVASTSRYFPQLTRYWRFVWSASRTWKLRVSERDMLTRRKNEAARSSTGDYLEPDRSYRVYAERGLTRCVAANLVGALGFSPTALNTHEPRIVINPGAVIYSPDEARKQLKENLRCSRRKICWFVWIGDQNMELTTPNGQLTDYVHTLIFVSNYSAVSDTASADTYIVLDGDNEVVVCTSDRAEALRKLAQIDTRRVASDEELDLDDEDV